MSEEVKATASLSSLIDQNLDTPISQKNEVNFQRQVGVRRKVWNWFLDSWTLNYAALLLAVFSLAITIFILGYYNGKPLSRWQQPVSFNTILSLLATAIKGSTMLATATALSQSKWLWYHTGQHPLQDFSIFTDASRGPLGAAQLLYRLRMWHLASLGAVVTLLALFSDAAVQASATIPLRTTDVGSASIPISTNYNFSAIQPPVIPTVDQVDPTIKASLYSGVLDLNSKTLSTAVTPECSTGDCSFPPYASLAFCSECKNLTSKMRQIPEIPAADILDTDSTFYLITNTGENLTLTVNYVQDPITLHQVLGLMNMTSVIGNPLRDNSVPLTEKSSPDETFALTDTSMIITPSFQSIDIPQVYRAFKCNLNLCMKEYAGSVTAGNLVETTSRTISTGWNLTDSAGTGDLDFIAFSGRLSDSRHVRVGIDLLTVMFLSNYLGAGLHGSESSSLTTPGPFAGSGVNDGGDIGWTNDIIQGIWENNQTDVSQTFENIAASLTTNIRLQSGQKIVGTAHSPVAFIHVRWIYMVLPITMVVLAVLFNLLITWRSRVCEVPVWGTNALADIVYAGGVAMDISAAGAGDGGIGGREGGVERPEMMLPTSELETWAEGKHARLRFRDKGEKGWI